MIREESSSTSGPKISTSDLGEDANHSYKRGPSWLCPADDTGSGHLRGGAREAGHAPAPPKRRPPRNATAFYSTQLLHW